MKAIILNKRVFAEGSEMVTIYSRELGKVRGVARSVKKPLSKLAFGLEQLFYSEVEVAKSRQNFLIIGVKPISTFQALRENIQAVRNAMVATEIILKSAADEQPNPELFDYFLGFLKHLEKNPKAGHSCLNFFILKALALTGYELDFEKCTICRKNLRAEQNIFFSNRKSGFLCEACSKKTGDTNIINKESHIALCEIDMADFDAQDRNPATEELYKFSKSFAEHLLERDLKAGRFLV